MKKLVIVVLMTLLTLTAILISYDLRREGASMEVNLYFTNNENSKIVLEKREIKVKDTDKVPELVIEELLKGSLLSDTKSVLPADTRLIDLDVDGTLAKVNLSSEYFKLGVGAEELIARFSIVKTLCDINNISNVKILIENKPLVNSKGDEIPAMSKDDTIIEDPSKNENDVPVVIYFADNELIELKKEIRYIQNKENLENHIMQEILKGPTDTKNLTRLIPAEVRLISTQVKESTCFINLSQEFITKTNHGAAAEEFMIYSIVNSLTELAGVKQVQFLIDGQKVETLSHMIFNEPFKRNIDLIGNK